MDSRVILYHKQSTSARTRFLKFNEGSVCAFGGLPKLAALSQAKEHKMVVHPAAILKAIETRLGLASGTLRSEGEFHHVVDIPGDRVDVLLAEIQTIDPPFDLAEQADAAFIDLTQARGLPPVELELLRYAYELVLGG